MGPRTQRPRVDGVVGLARLAPRLERVEDPAGVGDDVAPPGLSRASPQRVQGGHERIGHLRGDGIAGRGVVAFLGDHVDEETAFPHAAGGDHPAGAVPRSEAVEKHQVTGEATVHRAPVHPAQTPVLDGGDHCLVLLRMGGEVSADVPTLCRDHPAQHPFDVRRAAWCLVERGDAVEALSDIEVEAEVLPRERAVAAGPVVHRLLCRNHREPELVVGVELGPEHEVGAAAQSLVVSRLACGGGGDELADVERDRLP